ncbi:hypothetical protein G6M26_21035 [Agrobacterium tumefaciens]|nr:hypothetical protein [Agrobacterium tumefaciens]NTE21024.1 hypothetical protein [Agrobacterium tumefaciens]
MKKIDQHIALAVQERALIPSPFLLDGRTETDRLAFLSDFASLINFYDHDNQANGSWSPFLLKDPVILLAHIAKTNIDQIHALYRNGCDQVEMSLADGKISRDLVIGMNHLFDLLTSLFVKIERWTHYMLLDPTGYELKKYLLHQVKEIYSKRFWALLSLRNHLALLPYRYKIKPPYDARYIDFDHLIWEQNKDKSPYWEILDLANPFDQSNSSREIFQAIKNMGNQLLAFLETIVSHAPAAAETVKVMKGKYPDTLLIRAFVSLMTHYNTQLNDLSAKHLDFYYQDILNQSPKTSVGDQAVVFVDLAKTDASFKLPAKTLFSGGLDAQKKPILFESLNDVNLNPAVIKNIYTIGKFPGSNNLSGVQKIADPGIILKDQYGAVQSRSFFGKHVDSTDTKNGLCGFIISSPLLYLKEGYRNIILFFENAAFIPKLKLANYYLSTSAGWFAVQPEAVSVVQNNMIIITLVPANPEIIPFAVNPLQLDNSWPMLKMEFKESELLMEMNGISGISLSVNVSGVNSFQLYNDYGALSPQNPFQPFGPVPLKGSGFIIGSIEVFSKPISWLSIELNWNNLPGKFDAYYAVYNKYIGWNAKISSMDQAFDNFAFTAQFMLLQEGNWQALKGLDNGFDQLNETHTKCANVDPTLSSEWFLFQSINGVLQLKNSYFWDNINADPVRFANLLNADPNLQTRLPFKYTSNSTSGFMKIVLGGHPYGFGSGIYPAVVGQVANCNASKFYKHETDFISAPNLPFSPKISGVAASYSATADLNPDSDYPFQCYTYSPLAVHPFTFVPKPSADTPVQAALPVQAITAITTNELLFSAQHGGFLFMEIGQIAAAASLDVYFELAVGEGTAFPSRKFAYYYLNENGWNLLQILADGTAHLNCSGIVRFALPTSVNAQIFIGDTKQFWMALVADSSIGPFPSFVMIKINGVQVKRCADGIFTDHLAPASITKSQNPIPQISTITQPFPSFGGRPAENLGQMNKRVSLRLKTKDRAVTAEDYYRLIIKEYPSVFYTQTVFNRTTKTNQVFVVPAYPSWQAVNAFKPMANQQVLNDITSFLSQRSSGLISLNVSNFHFEPVNVNASIQLQEGFTCEGVKKEINHALNLYLSPWIDGHQPKVNIGEAIENVKLATFIQNIAGVAQVQQVDFNYINGGIYSGSGKLTVSGMNHEINCIE